MMHVWLLLSALLPAMGPVLAALDPARSVFYLPVSILLGVVILWACLLRASDIPSASRFLLAPFGLALAVHGFFLFLEEPSERYALSVLLTVLWLVYAEHVRLYIFESHRYRVYTLERLTFVFSTLSAFLWAAVCFGLFVLVQLPLWILVPLFFLGETIFLFETLWASKIEERQTERISIFGALLLTELFVVFSFFPLSHLVGAAVVALFHYALLGLLRAEQISRLKQNVVVRYGIFVGLLLVFILTTASWS